MRLVVRHRSDHIPLNGPRIVPRGCVMARSFLISIYHIENVDFLDYWVKPATLNVCR